MRDFSMDTIYFNYGTFIHDLAEMQPLGRHYFVPPFLLQCVVGMVMAASLLDTEDNMSVDFVVAGLVDPIVHQSNHPSRWRGRHVHTLYVQWHRRRVLGQMQQPRHFLVLEL